MKDKLSKEEIAKLHDISDQDLDKFFNSNGKVFKEMELKDKLKEMTNEEKLELLASDGMLMKRPIVSDRVKTVIIGFKEKEFEDKVK